MSEVEKVKRIEDIKIRKTSATPPYSGSHIEKPIEKPKKKQSESRSYT